ncbi:DNA replication complex GINS protein PSF3 isoform X2 [Amborella trichopoda]|uniref:DNA replication complex GINS protein PSF3 isoform X2 n=1 Tax=Amborella trichopoda TaxID=13333 RepID=UPI0009BEC9F4|nr:DNA replication complex GINS protein PSF3 isoform X2 [Amborella trichopoda]XP_011628085.2 DNA replication complex GINS protein PSF3 isoform X2 [Amborella trichopoda]|eukprot:XP_006857266.2 DNA replication complex GINS protein PSF3 isoform X2 [Amborella trichopoda]
MSHYYDIDDIIVDEELVSVVFQVTANGVGLLDPGSETNSVEQGAKIDVTFWLAQELYLREAASINLPMHFNQKTRKEVQADPECVDLRSRCPYFYELGYKIAPMVADKELGTFISLTFNGRYKEILSKSHGAAFAAVPKFLPRLTKEETNLYEAARNSMIAFKEWRLGVSRLEGASVLGRKRKPIIEREEEGPMLKKLYNGENVPISIFTGELLQDPYAIS